MPKAPRSGFDLRVSGAGRPRGAATPVAASVVRPGHETIELERAVEWADEYVIVDKVNAAEPLVADDPRGAPSA